jgi:hypothetical protein
MIIIWTPSATANVAFGSDTNEETQYEKEHWKPRLTLQYALWLALELHD